MEYLDTPAYKLKSPDDIHPEEISSIVADVAGPGAAWAKIDYDPQDRNLTLIAGQGLGRVTGLRVVALGGKTIKKWFVADRYEPQNVEWRSFATAVEPQLLHLKPSRERFDSLRSLLDSRVAFIPGRPLLYHRP